MELTTGKRLRSGVCTTEVIVVKAPTASIDLTCGGEPMREISSTEPAGTLDPAYAAGTALGKRYHHAASQLEVLCTKSGDGSLAVGAEQLEIQEPKKLPSND